MTAQVIIFPRISPHSLDVSALAYKTIHYFAFPLLKYAQSPLYALCLAPRSSCCLYRCSIRGLKTPALCLILALMKIDTYLNVI